MAEDEEVQELEDMRRRQSRTRQAVELSAGAGATRAESAPDKLEAVGGEDEAAAVAATDEAIGEERAQEPAEDAADNTALEYWRQAVLNEPSNVGARRRLARVLTLRGDALLAVEQLEAARAVQPENVELIIELTNAQIALKRFDVAERDLRRTLRFQPDHAEVHLGLGVISFRRGLYAQAEQELRRAIELNPESASAYFYRGEALNQLSRVDEAIDMLVRATQLQPSNSRAYYVMGILYDKKSRPQEAAAMYRKAREVGAA